MDTLLKIYPEVCTTSFICAIKRFFWVLLRFNPALLLVAWIFFSTLSLASAEKLVTSPESSTSDFFIEFKPGDYQNPITSSIDELSRQLNIKYANHYITLVGKSESISSLASQKLALNRAKIIKKLLVKKGYKADQIMVDGNYENFKDKDKLQHGVAVLFSQKAQLEKTLKSNGLRTKQLNSELTRITFIEFSPSEYKQTASGEIQRLLKQLRQYPKTTNIKVVGISQSKTNLATKNLALIRARTVARSLISGGISARRLILDGKITNQVKSEYLTHGAYIYVYPNEHSINKVVKIKQKTTEYQTHNTVITATSQNKQQNIDPIDNTNNSETKLTSKSRTISKKPSASMPSISTDLCSELTIKKGSLKTNIQREIADCGYLMGDWNFGTDEELIDWLIPIPYSVKVEKGIFGVLNLIEENYQIRAHVHQLDKSIDFLASIKYDRGQ
jgi:outer membrane protein OmpA-like peptidoglycan-associated protein